MTFLNPLLLLGTLGIALPILAHLLNKHKFKQTDWAAMQFLNRNVRIRSRQLHLKDLLLLLLRCLAVLLLILALSRPSSQNPDSSWFSGERRAGVIIALDASYSMEHSDGKSTRFERAIEKIDVIAETIALGDPVCLVMLGSEPRVVARNMAFDPQRFKEILRAQKTTPESLDLSNVSKRLKELAEKMDASQKEIYLITDVQTLAWDQHSDRLRDKLKELGESASVFMVPVSGDSENLAVTDLDLVSGVLRKGTVARYQATVKNFGTNPVSNVEVQCQADGAQVDTKRIPLIQPGSSETVSLFVPFHNSGVTRIAAKISGDSLTTDNVRRVAAVVRDRVSVLCIDGTSGGGGRLITSALMARNNGVEDKNYIVRSVPWLSLPTQDLETVDVIIMANVPEITSDQAMRLSNYVRQGNGLVWFGGDNVKASKWNQHSKPGLNQLIPAEISQLVDSRDGVGAGKPLDPSMPDHFVNRPLHSLPEDLLNDTRFLKRYQLKPNADSIPVLKLAGSDTPILIEHSLGRGHVFMFATSAEATWNNMALTPVFPMLMQQIVTYLAGREFEQARIVGDSLSLSYADQPDASDAVFNTPSDKTITVPVKKYRNQYIALLKNAQEAGFYTVKVSVQAAGIPVAVNVDTRESDISCLPEADLKKNLENTDIAVVSTKADLLTAIKTTRTGRSSWRIFMIAGLILLFIECLFADFLLTKRQPGKKQTAPSKNREMAGAEIQLNRQQTASANSMEVTGDV